MDNAGITARLSGWVHRKRDHGNLLFIDLRDHYGLTQCVIEIDADNFETAEAIRPESVVTVTGRIERRSDETINPDLQTGEIELRISEIQVESAADTLPLQVAGDVDFPEDLRLRYRFLDLRREHVHTNIILRNSVISSIRRRMTDAGFLEFQTPILTASSPEGARDYLVPSRIHPGKFTPYPKPHRFLNSSSWCQVLISIFKSRRVFGTRMHGLTGRPVSFTNLTWRCLFAPKTMSLTL